MSRFICSIKLNTFAALLWAKSIISVWLHIQAIKGHDCCLSWLSYAFFFALSCCQFFLFPPFSIFFFLIFIVLFVYTTFFSAWSFVAETEILAMEQLIAYLKCVLVFVLCWHCFFFSCNNPWYQFVCVNPCTHVCQCVRTLVTKPDEWYRKTVYIVGLKRERKQQWIFTKLFNCLIMIC